MYRSNSVNYSRWTMRNTIALSVTLHMTPEGALEQSLLVTVLVVCKRTVGLELHGSLAKSEC